LGETSLALFADYINKTVLDVDELVSGLTDGDTARHILNAWEQMQVNPLLRAPDGDHEAQAQLHYLNLLNEQIDKIVFWCGTLTIPERLAAWLDTQRPGYYVPFNQVFEDELPNPEDRLRLLESLALAPKLLRNGFVDLEAGLVYRYSEKKLERLRSFAYLILAALLFTGIVVGACLPAWPGWPLERENLAALLVGWVALLVGVIVHNGVGSVKRSRARGGLPVVVAPSEWQIIINAKAGQMILKLFIALIGLFALVFSSGIDQVTLFNSFLVGYSLDSFVEMFGASMEQRAGAQLSAMQQKLGGG
jgi:hypothetical protein